MNEGRGACRESRISSNRIASQFSYLPAPGERVPRFSSNQPKLVKKVAICSGGQTILASTEWVHCRSAISTSSSTLYASSSILIPSISRRATSRFSTGLIWSFFIKKTAFLRSSCLRLANLSSVSSIFSLLFNLLAAFFSLPVPREIAILTCSRMRVSNLSTLIATLRWDTPDVHYGKHGQCPIRTDLG